MQVIKIIFVPFFFIFFYSFSYYFSMNFSAGDQEYYHDFYNNLYGLSFSEAFVFYKESLGSLEPVYFLMVYFASEYFSKNVFFSIINTIFAWLVFRVLCHRKVNIVVFLMVFSNFYFFVLLFSAERLKVAVFLLLLSFFVKNYFIRGCVQLFSFLSHAQISLLILAQSSGFFKNIIIRFLDFKARTIDFLYIVFFAFLVFLGVYFIGEHVFVKLTYYIDVSSIGIADAKPVFFLFLTFFYAKNRRFEAFLAFLPLITLVFFIGSDRVTIFSYFVFLYYALDYNKGLNLGVFLTGLYFMVQGVEYLNKVLLYGDGFYCNYNAC